MAHRDVLDILAENIERRSLALFKNQKELAKAAKVSPSLISKIQTRQQKRPELSKLQKIASALKCEVYELFMPPEYAIMAKIPVEIRRLLANASDDFLAGFFGFLSEWDKHNPQAFRGPQTLSRRTR